MTIDLDTAAQEIIGKYLDLDGAPRAQPYQCHDVWLWWLYKLGGRPGEGYAPDDYTVSVFTSFPYMPRLAELFTKHDGAAGIRKGDVLFWRRGVWYPGSHVAIADGPADRELVPTITQNPGPVKRATLITRDLVGYLRPRTLNPSRKGLTLPALIQNHDKSIGFVSDAGMLDPISTMREVDSLKMTGVVGEIVPFKDGTVWNALAARTARLRAQQSTVDPKRLAAEVAALMVGPVIAALSKSGQLTQADVEAAVEKVTKELLAKAAA